MDQLPDRRHDITTFLTEQQWVSEPFNVSFLAAGEYNENYTVTSPEGTAVFRINHGTQLNLEDQISYEHTVLQALVPSGVTPRPLRVSPHHRLFPRGVLLMEFLPGRPLDYQTDVDGAAVCFARVHGVPVTSGGPTSHLVRQLNPVHDILLECDSLLSRYPDNPRSDLLPAIRRYFDRVEALSRGADADFSDEEPCITNTEVNSGNFRVDGDLVRLVDWEKAVVSYRYQDLGHFVVPTTTLWKTDYRFSAEARSRFLASYHRASAAPVPLEVLDLRTQLLERTILLRAYSWCYMASAEYAAGARALKNERTEEVINYYLDNIEAFLGV